MASSYQQKLLDPRWQKKRLEVMELNGFECQSCGSTTDTLHVHHRQYLKGREPWEYHWGQLECLCDKCHKDEHRNLEDLKISLSWCGHTEEVIGFVRGILFIEMSKETPDGWKIRSHEEAVGFGKALGVTADVIIDAIKDNGCIDASLLTKQKINGTEKASYPSEPVFG